MVTSPQSRSKCQKAAYRTAIRLYLFMIQVFNFGANAQDHNLYLFIDLNPRKEQKQITDDQVDQVESGSEELQSTSSSDSEDLEVLVEKIVVDDLIDRDANPAGRSDHFDGSGAASSSSGIQNLPPTASPSEPLACEEPKPEAPEARLRPEESDTAAGTRNILEGLKVKKPSLEDATVGSEFIGWIKFKPQKSDLFVKCPVHLACTKTKSCRANPRNRSQGRPLGYLAAWAYAASEFPDKQQHMSECKPSRSDRTAARNILKQEPNWGEFARHERDKVAGEESEPEACP